MSAKHPPTNVDVVRALADPPELRSEAEGLGVMAGHFSVFDTWYRVSSVREGEFIERTAAGFVKDTIAADRSRMRVLFDHGFDQQIGNKVLGTIKDLREDGTGAYYEVALLDTSYNRDLRPGLEAGVYGASFRMRVQEDSWNDEPERSDHNPDQLPERTITRAKVLEFGPVTFPANPDATAGVRSLTDEYYARRQLRSVPSLQLPAGPMSDAERSRRYRARKKLGDQAVPRTPPGQKVYPPLGYYAAQAAARTEREEGLRLLNMDPQRLRDRVAAVDSRNAIDRDEIRRHITGLASALKKARRLEELSLADWRAKPTAENLAEVESAMRTRSLLGVQLAEPA